mgnify:CR=1 FL=1
MAAKKKTAKKKKPAPAPAQCYVIEVTPGGGLVRRPASGRASRLLDRRVRQALVVYGD